MANRLECGKPWKAKGVRVDIDVTLAEQMLAEGKTLKQVGEHFGASGSAVDNRIRRAGLYVPLPPGPRTWNAATIQVAKNERQQEYIRVATGSSTRYTYRRHGAVTIVAVNPKQKIYPHTHGDRRILGSIKSHNS